MQHYKQAFIELALAKKVLRFGEFTLKSGRISPYFFNSGQFSDGASLAGLARFYSDCIIDAGIEFDMVFGPAYKGIPLAAAVAMEMSRRGKTIPYCFNRKEEKDHGEGGDTLGAPLQGRVLIIDDVITAGTSVRQSVDLIRRNGAEPGAVVLALDRKERGQGELSAAQEAERMYDLRVISIVCLDEIIEYLQHSVADAEHLARIRTYQERYGVT